MSEFIMAQQNGRNIPLEDKVFGINRLAKEMIAEKGKEAVMNATIGALLSDSKDLVVLSSVVEVLKNLEPADYAEYAPIGGTPEFRTAIKKAAFGKYKPNCFTEAVATPGGTGAIRNAIDNYSKIGDQVLTSDWHWANYDSVANEMGRSVVTYNLFDGEDQFNIAGLKERAEELLAKQESLVIIINTPAHNPTGYSLTLEDWDNLLKAVKGTATPDKKVTLVVDVAYIDFAGDPDEYREFLPKLENLPSNILPIIAYSASKTFTMYGMRCAAMICMTPVKEIAEEFVRVCQFSSRASWSNCTRASMVVLSKIYEDSTLLAKVDQERSFYCDLLLKRGRAFAEEADKVGLRIVPFDAGFFASIPCENSDEINKKLQKEGIFLIPLKKGLRVSIASITEKECRELPAKILAAME
ncbi:pyridoxal phosphate-dependent aminotransferase [Aminipila luticellarii]|uniref:Aminotransferase class I/II-fold pyridoxal phosphate-dependent enzyme n=1 Tax=Aminipila luticellarii TaxID=2507160 RepID=A0A410PT91_9FIRM|nr:aminotransferase class I/II-fold pyridoxal phosphate-dependent enzyme [Aminipila luticellarii]QAT42088.1 aminotransferase class I/II-fold pyridoxal phosphate-dependent enzyme [Aminipila luticellarii]